MSRRGATALSPATAIARLESPPPLLPGVKSSRDEPGGGCHWSSVAGSGDDALARTGPSVTAPAVRHDTNGPQAVRLHSLSLRVQFSVSWYITVMSSAITTSAQIGKAVMMVSWTIALRMQSTTAVHRAQFCPAKRASEVAIITTARAMWIQPHVVKSQTITP